MENNRVFIILLIFFLSLPLIVFTENHENYRGYNLSYYDNGIGGTPSGLGGAFVSIADDGNAPFYNPAGLPDIRKKIITLNYRSSFIGGENLFYFSYLLDLNKTSGIGFFAIWSGISDLERYDENQYRSGSYGVSRFQVSVSYGLSVLSRVNLGLTGKYFYHSISDYYASNLDIDVGAMVKILPGLKYGLVFQNFIPMGYKLRDVSEDIPLTVKTGFNYTFFKAINLLFAYEIERTIISPFKATSFIHHIGIRCSPYKYFTINAGYDMENFSLGLNLNLENFIFYLGSIRNINAGNMNFSTAYVFPEQEDTTSADMEIFYEGIVAYQNKDYRSAIKYFRKYLDKHDDPVAEWYLKYARAYRDSEEWMSTEEIEYVDLKLGSAKKYIANQEYGKGIQTLRDVLVTDPDNDEADRLLRKAKNLVASDTEEYYKDAKSLFDEKKYQESLNKCELALSLNPEYTPALDLKKQNEEILKDVLSEERKDKQKQEEAETLFNAGMDSLKTENWVDAIDKLGKSYKLVQDANTKRYLDLAKTQLKESKVSEKKAKESDIYLQLGKTLYKNNKIKEAIVEFEKAVNLYPENTGAQTYLTEARKKYDDMIKRPLENGQRALRENRLGDAINYFNEVLKIDPNNVIARKYLNRAEGSIKESIILNLRLGKQAFDRKEYSKALEYYRNVLKIDELKSAALIGEKKSLAQLQTQIRTYLNKGTDLYNKKKYKDAVKEFENALALDKEYPITVEWLEKANKQYEKNRVSLNIEDYMLTGIGYFQNKSYKQAKVSFNKVLGLDKENKEAEDYIKKCDEGIKKQGKQDEIAKFIGEAMKMIRRRKFKEAIEILEKAKEKDPQNKLIQDYIDYAKISKEESENRFYNDGVKFLEEGNLAKAKENLEKAREINPKHEEARKKLLEVNSAIAGKVRKAIIDGKNYFKNGEYSKAAGNFKLVLKLDLENEEIEDLLKDTVTIEKYLSEAKDYMAKSKYGDAYNSLKSVEDYNKNDPNVKRLKKEALAKGKGQSSRWFNDALADYEKGNLKEAQMSFSRVLDVEPGHSEAKKYLVKVDKDINNKVVSFYKKGVSYLGRKDYKNAVREFNKVLKLKSKYKDTSKLLRKAAKADNKQRSGEIEKMQQKIQKYLFEGISRYKEEKLDEAIALWKKVLKIDPRNEKAVKYIKRAEYKKREIEKLK